MPNLTLEHISEHPRRAEATKALCSRPDIAGVIGEFVR